SKSIPGMGVVPGIATTGTINVSTMGVNGGFAFAQRPQSLTGAWQYMGSGADVGFATVYLTHWNTAMGMRDTIAKGAQSLSGMVMSWTNFTVTLTYMGGANPDTAQIILSSSGATPAANSYLYVDNLAFAGSVAGIKENNLNAASAHLFPNPATDKLVVSISNLKASTGQIEIYDVIGNKVKAINNVDFTSNTTIDVADLNQGGYFIKVSTSQGVITKKFLKQ
ncbi:MAG: T9SS type A sorting domain-containing protein, partial [Bacteroidia bacterium]